MTENPQNSQRGMAYRCPAKIRDKKSQRGKDVLIDDKGYTYNNKQRKDASYIEWQCSKRSSTNKCRAAGRVIAGYFESNGGHLDGCKTHQTKTPDAVNNDQCWIQETNFVKDDAKCIGPNGDVLETEVIVDIKEGKSRHVQIETDTTEIEEVQDTSEQWGDGEVDNNSYAPDNVADLHSQKPSDIVSYRIPSRSSLTSVEHLKPDAEPPKNIFDSPDEDSNGPASQTRKPLSACEPTILPLVIRKTYNTWKVEIKSADGIVQDQEVLKEDSSFDGTKTFSDVDVVVIDSEKRKENKVEKMARQKSKRTISPDGVKKKTQRKRKADKLKNSAGPNSAVASSKRRKKDFNINNIVIPQSVASSTKIEKLQYKEIDVPGWRCLSEEDPPVVKHSELSEAELQDLSVAAVPERHAVCEADERRRFTEYYKAAQKNHKRSNSICKQPNISNQQTTGVARGKSATLSEEIQTVGEVEPWPLRTFPLSEEEYSGMRALETTGKINSNSSSDRDLE